LLFLQEIISEVRSFSAGSLGRRRRSERNNSEITACSGRAPDKHKRKNPWAHGARQRVNPNRLDWSFAEIAYKL
jgi:hypothetical protein